MKEVAKSGNETNIRIAAFAAVSHFIRVQL